MLAAWRREGALVLRADGELGADDEIGAARLENVDGPTVEVGITEVDFVADDDLPAGEEDPLLHCLAVVRLAEAHQADLPLVDVRVLRRELLRDGDRAVLRPVLGEYDLVAPTERFQPLAEIDDRRVQDALFVVDGDDKRDARVAGHDGRRL